ncbi:YjdF family protein [Liquorilactobacillus capillatus]|uniref:Uncharacterized protein n=1 Tax=Liquorilactobacillus capillatus DSM 19910 TaxID=1423731 RepID=A0A0R1MAT7_9LACO|nr:YjdF family protein [Liquorilactobacillus capillatus]KRL01107.1 hypothetical protein FC81_GL001246 [Liquorilactobacillus capillatus DSM 19910]
MLRIKGSLTISYEPPFYHGIFEEETVHSYRVAQVNFGTAVPKTRFIYSYLLTHYQDLVFYEQQQDASLALHRVNPKRRQRLARKAIKKVFKGTKAQQTLQKQYRTKKHAVKVHKKSA